MNFYITLLLLAHIIRPIQQLTPIYRDQVSFTDRSKNKVKNKNKDKIITNPSIQQLEMYRSLKNQIH